MAKISFDFDSIKNRILTKLSSMSEWASFLDYGTTDNVVSSLANEMAYEIQYAEYNTIENFWNMARNRSSLLQMSPMHGFIIPRKQGSVGTIRISTSETFDSSYPTDIVIPKFFQFSGNDIFVCTTNEKDILNANENYVDLDCKQGEVKTLSFLAEGIQYEEKNVYDDSVDNSFFVLTVNGVEWKYVDSLFLYGPEEQVYQIRTFSDLGGVTIRFGNNVFGKKLNKNDVVEFKYISTLGANGNIFSSNIITTVESQAFDNNGYSVKLYCNNITSFIGGIDYPSLDYIREISPKVYQTGNRASSRDDYYTILRQISYISKVSVWGAYETLKDQNKDPWDFIPHEENVIHIAVLDTAYEPITDTQKNNIVDELHDLCDPTDLISFESVAKIPMIFHIDGTIINSSYTTSEVKASIKSALSSVYGIENMNFGESVYNSDYVRLIDEVSGIDNHISYIYLLYENLRFTSEYQCDINLPIYPIDILSVKIYMKDESIEDSDYELFATCDVNGNIIGESTYITTESSIDKNTGKGKLIVSNGLSGDYHNYVFKIEYQYLEEDLKNNKRNNILYYRDAEINLIYK